MKTRDAGPEGNPTRERGKERTDISVRRSRVELLSRVFGPLRATFAAFLISGAVFSTAAFGSEDVPTFESDIAPILSQKCGKCHSDRVQKGALDLSSMRALRKGGESGEPLVGESIDESLLWAMIDGGDMPPEGQPGLTSDERATIKSWLERGAPSHEKHSLEEDVPTQHDVIPIVLLRCATCHGARMKQGGVDMRTPAAMKRGGKNGPALVSGEPDNSLLIQRIESAACPPREQLLKFFVRRPP